VWVSRGGKYLPARSTRTSFAASTLAGLSRFGVSADKRDITLTSYCKVNSELDNGTSAKIVQCFPPYAQAAISLQHLHTHTDRLRVHADRVT
jgi:hypothetical protein